MEKPVLVTCYVNPDLDGVAGVVAYTEFLQKNGQNAIARIIGVPHPEAEFVLNRFDLPRLQMIRNADNFTEVILIDASDLSGLEGKVDPKKVFEIIDHRKVHEVDKFPNANVQIELVGAAATLIAEKFARAQLDITETSAILLYCAIISNTLNFRAYVTTDRDRRAAEWLNQRAKLPKGFWKELFAAKSDLFGKKLTERIEGDFAHFTFGGKKIGIAQVEMMGARKLINKREKEIVHILESLKKDMNLDFVFQNTIDLEKGVNFLVSGDVPTRKFLEEILNVHFDGSVAERSRFIMRKEITPLIKEKLER